MLFVIKKLNYGRRGDKYLVSVRIMLDKFVIDHWPSFNYFLYKILQPIN